MILLARAQWVWEGHTCKLVEVSSACFLYVGQELDIPASRLDLMVYLFHARVGGHGVALLLHLEGGSSHLMVR